MKAPAMTKDAATPTSEGLMPCPFCGGTDIREQPTHHGRPELYCAFCRAGANKDVWAHRVTAPVKGDDVERAAREALERIIVLVGPAAGGSTVQALSGLSRIEQVARAALDVMGRG